MQLSEVEVFRADLVRAKLDESVPLHVILQRWKTLTRRHDGGVADACGVHRVSVVRWRNGRTIPSLALRRLAYEFIESETSKLIETFLRGEQAKVVKKRTEVGEVYGRWTVIGELPMTKSQRMVLCRCVCGIERAVRDHALRFGNNCGCKACQLKEWSETKTLRNMPEYEIWAAMCGRCHTKSSTGYKWYGVRGIRVFDGWRGPGGFDRFIAYIGRRPGDEYTIERVENDGNYEPGNVKWATRAEQSVNKRNNVILEFQGRRQTQSQWSSELGFAGTTILARLKRGWSVERALSQPRDPRGRVKR